MRLPRFWPIPCKFIHHILRGEARSGSLLDLAGRRNGAHPMKIYRYKFLRLLLSAALLLLSGAASAPGQDTSRKILKRVKVEYPPLLKEHHIGGTVRLRVIVRADGTVRDTELIGGSPVLGDCAQKSVKQWVFAPGAAESAVEVSIVFDPAHNSDD